MMLYLLRHGIAVDADENGVVRDSERRLTDEGRRKAAIVGKGLSEIGVEPDLIASSPLVRAKETAEIVAKILGAPGDIEVLDMLAPGMDFASVTAWVNTRKMKAIMLVGHSPDLQEYASYLISSSADTAIELKKAGACCIEFDGAAGKGRGVLRWLIPPAVFKTLV